uniref:ParB/RepB/Spo0J family partition protein n=1 Tax=Eubacterium cellulosolvens TaxID=29322 RepID=UPI0004808320|nr:ParB N-terminal domain-containing protein [[Eubacterium] cellulosolvens]
MGSSLLKSVSQKSKELKKINTEVPVSELSAEDNARVKTIASELLEDDPWNEEIYGEIEIEKLAKSIEKYGFTGVIMAYPIEDGKYRIESGHRRRAGGVAAGMKEFPVYVTETPKTEYERRIRLALGNAHSREMTPTRIARLAESLEKAHREEVTAEMQSGELPSDLTKGRVTEEVNARVSLDLELSTKIVYKYKQLLKLVPELQDLADAPNVPWSAIGPAASLAEERQRQFALSVKRMIALNGSVTRKEIEEQLYTFQHMLTGMSQYDYDPNDERYLPDSEKNRESDRANKARRKNGAKLFEKGYENLMEALTGDDIMFKSRDRETILRKLEELREVIEGKIGEFENL